MTSRWLAIGVNTVDPGGYGGWDGPLAACENDARDMAGIAAAQGYRAQLLLTAQATSHAVLRALHEAAEVLAAGQQLVVSYSGHGGQVHDAGGDEAGDQLDETWCLFDRMLLDDELQAAWARFAPGVRILVVSDSCHSGSVTKAPWGAARPRRMPRAQAQAVFERHRALYRQAATQARAGEAAVRARVLLLSGCQDDQLALDGPVNGAFTAALKAVWEGGAFQGSHADFHAAIAGRLRGTAQTPNYTAFGGDDPAFEAARPFTPGAAGAYANLA